MRRYKQLIVSNGIGDCVRTCLACMLDRTPKSIPNFTQQAVDHKKALRDGEAERDMWDFLTEWAHGEGLSPLRLTDHGNQGWFTGLDLFMLDGALCMVSLPSQRYKGGYHAVVGQVQVKGQSAYIEIVHDVSPSNPPYPWFAKPTQLLFLLPRLKHLPSARKAYDA